MSFTLREKSVLHSAREECPSLCERRVSFTLREKSVLHSAREECPSLCERRVSFTLREKSVLHSAREECPSLCERRVSFTLSLVERPCKQSKEWSSLFTLHAGRSSMAFVAIPFTFCVLGLSAMLIKIVQ